MRLLLLTAVFIAAPALADKPAATPLCRDARNRLTEQRGTVRGGIHPLGQEPPANQTLAVLRDQGGCTRPVDVRHDVGAKRGGS